MSAKLIVTKLKLLPCNLAFVLPLCSCISLGAGKLDRDHLDYARAVSETGKEQTLFNVVRMRYGEPPAFLGINQIIAGYTAQASGQIGLNGYPSAASGNFATLLGTAQYVDHPTFTFSPITGQEYASAYLQPIRPAALLALAQSGIPIDILFRLAVQSINGLQNSNALGAGLPRSTGAFYQLISNLRRLQETGDLVVRDEARKDTHRIFITLGSSAMANDIKTHLRLHQELTEYEVSYGAAGGAGDAIVLLTRPMLGVLFQIGAQAEVPAVDVAAGRTFETSPDLSGARQPVIVIHGGSGQPEGPFTSVLYRKRWFWIDNDDFNSKVAFTVVQVLEAVAKSSNNSMAPTVTIPTN